MRRRGFIAPLGSSAVILPRTIFAEAPNKRRLVGLPEYHGDQLWEDKMMEMTGGCLCGRVRYSAKEDPVFVGVCHCTHCQRQTGTAFSVLVGIPKSAMSLQGQVKTFHDTGDSGQPVDRSFCPECGSPIFSDVAVMPGVTFIKAGTLDDTTWLDPKMHVYCDSAERWTPIPDASQRFAKMPA